MTGRTHDLAGFTALSIVLATQQLPQMSLATGVVSLSAVLLGALAPDLDQSTSDFWDKIPAGNVFGKMLAPIMGGHRFISHSLLGVFLFGFGLDKLLQLISTVLIVDIHIVWWSFMIGFVSHLFLDTFNREGIPILFPIPWHLGLPPLRLLRIKTGGMFEKAIIFPGLILLNGYIYYASYGKIVEFVRNNIKY